MKKYDSYDLRNGKDGYEWALTVAGANVLAYQSFGSYQGDWFAKVDYKGDIFWIKGSYGSCSGCDAWEAESGWEDKTKEEWRVFCTNFAQSYLNDPLTYEQVLKDAEEDVSWDVEAKEMIKWVKKNK